MRVDYFIQNQRLSVLINSQMRARAFVRLGETEGKEGGGGCRIMQFLQTHSCSPARSRRYGVNARQSFLARSLARARACVLPEKVEGRAILSSRHLEINGRGELCSPSLPA